LTIGAFLGGLVLVGIRLGGLFVFAPLFSSAAIPARVKAVLLTTMTVTLGPLLVVGGRGAIVLSLTSIAREAAIALVFALALNLVLEMANTAGQIAGLQFSFSLVNLLDPNSNIETSALSQMFQLWTTTLLITAGLDRVMLGALLRTYQSVPLGGTAMHPASVLALLPLAGGILLAAFELVAPLIAATVLLEVSIALLSRLSPQLPVMALTIPAKSITGYVVLIASLSLWSAFIENRFSHLLDAAQSIVVRTFAG